MRGFMRVEGPLAKSPDKVQVRYLYKTDIAEILAGLKASGAENDWVLRNTRSRATFERIARMISAFGEGIRNESASAGFEAANMEPTSPGRFLR
jgi:hypothetical protein